jgi:DNA-binding transcriptional MocR family regulator
MSTLGIPTVEDQVLVTSGAQQAIDLVARFFGGPHMSVIVEDPTYPPAIDSFRATGARFVSVPLDGDGVRSDLIALHARRGAGQALFLNPICQNPTGTLLPEDRAKEIARVANDTGTVIIDDITSAYLLYDGSPVPIAVHDPADRVITIGSLSKVAWGGLRIGWVRASRSLVNQLAARKIDTDISTNLFTQAIGVRMLGRFDELVARSRTAALDRLAVTEAALERLLPSWTWARPAGGLCLWVRLPAGDAASFAHVAASHGVIVRPGQQFSASGGHRDRMRIAFGHEPELLEAAYQRLAAAWRDFRPTEQRRTQSLAITV